LKSAWVFPAVESRLEATLSYIKAVLFCMSGTGNTFRAAKWMEAEAEKQKIETRLIHIGYNQPKIQMESNPQHLVGLLAPTHGFTAPWKMIKFACLLPRAKGTNAFVAVTRAGSRFGKKLRLPGMEGTAGYLLAVILAMKGYRVRGVTGIDMPSNWTAVHPSMNVEHVNDIVSRAKPMAERFIGRILSGGRSFDWPICPALGILLLQVSFGYLLIGRFFLAKLFFASLRCNGCGQCAMNCPFGAIRMFGRRNPRPYWTYHCESCMRCMAYCPQKAIEAGHTWAVLLYLISSTAAVIFICNRLAPAIPQAANLGKWLENAGNPWLAMLATYPYYLASMLIAYFIFNRLIRLRAINALFTYTTLTRVFRRYHEPETEVKEMAAANLEKCTGEAPLFDS
jgi:ferredoxin/flavodoxin